MINNRKKDKFWIGLLSGLAVPVVAYGILLFLYDLLEDSKLISDIGFASDFRTRTLMLFAICGNLILLNYFRKGYMDNSMRGVVFPTLLFMVLWFIYYGRNLLNL
jgi:hypothetical protein